MKKGELTVDQGKDLNRELTQKAKGAVDGAQETVLRAHLAGMTPEQRAAFVDRARSLASDLDAKEQEAAKAEEPEDEGTTVTVEADDESEKDAEE